MYFRIFFFTRSIIHVSRFKVRKYMYRYCHSILATKLLFLSPKFNVEINRALLEVKDRHFLVWETTEFYWFNWLLYENDNMLSLVNYAGIHVARMPKKNTYTTRVILLAGFEFVSQCFHQQLSNLSSQIIIMTKSCTVLWLLCIRIEDCSINGRFVGTCLSIMSHLMV